MNMRVLACFVLFALWNAPPSFAQENERPVTVAACDLRNNPLKYQHVLVTIRAPIDFGFEDFTLGTVGCDHQTAGSDVWLEFGGDLGSQTIYCCGDHSRTANTIPELDGYPLPLEKNRTLDEFLRVLNARRKLAPTGGPCYDCFLYKVTATLTGRFFAGGWRTQEANPSAPKVGYGHLGCCSLLVIQRVADIASERTPIPEATRYTCAAKIWRRNKEGFSADITPSSPSNGSIETEPEEAGIAALRWFAANWKVVPPDREPEIHKDFSRPVWPRAVGEWTSADKTRTFSIELRMKGELSTKVDNSIRGDWVPYSVNAKVCTEGK